MILNKKGVTPVVAIVLLLLITVGVAGSANIFLGSLLDNTKADADASLKDTTNSALQEFNIAYLSCDSVGNIATAIQNVGSVDIPAGTLGIRITNSSGEFVTFDSTVSNSLLPSRSTSAEISWTGLNTAALATGNYDITLILAQGKTKTGKCTVS